MFLKKTTYILYSKKFEIQSLFSKFEFINNNIFYYYFI